MGTYTGSCGFNLGGSKAVVLDGAGAATIQCTGGDNGFVLSGEGTGDVIRSITLSGAGGGATGVLLTSGSSPSIQSSTFTSWRVGLNISASTSASLTSVTFMNHQGTTNSGGAIVVGGTLTGSGLTFTSNTGLGAYGASVHVVPGGVATIIGVSSTNSNSSLVALAADMVVQPRGSLSLTSATFSGCASWSTNGTATGCACIYSQGTTTITGGNFDNNGFTLRVGGRILTNDNGTMNIYNSTCRNCSAIALYLLNGATSLLQDVQLVNTTEGPLRVYGSTITLRNVYFWFYVPLSVSFPHMMGLYQSCTVLVLNSHIEMSQQTPGWGIVTQTGDPTDFTIDNSTFINCGNAVLHAGVTIRNSTFLHNMRTVSGPGTVRLTNCLFSNNGFDLLDGGWFAGAIEVSVGRSAFVSNTTFEYNHNWYGGAIVNRGTLELSNCAFNGNYGWVPSGNSPASGGAIYSSIVSTSTNIVNCSFNGNAMYNSSNQACGGAICALGGSLSVVGSSFTNNFASGPGGAIAALNTTNATISNCTFLGNRVASANGASLHLQTSAVIVNCTFTSGSSGWSDVVMLPGGSLSMTNVKFVNCQGPNATCIYTSSPTTINGGVFDYNGQFLTSKGQIIFGNASALNVSRITCTNCTSTVVYYNKNVGILENSQFYGVWPASVQMNSATLTIRGWTFQSAQVPGFSSAEYWSALVAYGGNTLVIQRSSLVTSPTVTYGYSIWFYDGGYYNTLRFEDSVFAGFPNGMGANDLTATNATFTKNCAPGFNGKYIGCTFVDNGCDLAAGWPGGLSISYDPAMPAKVINTTFIGNFGTFSPAIFNRNNLDVIGCNFINNHAGRTINVANTTYQAISGAIFNAYGGGPVGMPFLRVMNSTFTANSADGNTGVALAGAIYALDGTVLVQGCTFDSNTAVGDGGAIAISNASLTIDNSLFYQNSAQRGGALFLVYTANVTISNSVFQLSRTSGNGAHIYFDAYNGWLRITGSSFLNGFSPASGGSIFFKSGHLALDQDNQFIANSQANSPFEADFSSISGSCSISGPVPVSTHGCPGSPGYSCDVLCQPGEVQTAKTTCGASAPSFSGGSCSPIVNISSAWVYGGNYRINGSNYGTLGLYAATNIMGPHRSSWFAPYPRDPTQMLVFGGVGYDEGDTLAPGDLGGWSLSDTWSVSTAGDMSRQTWMSGPRSTTSAWAQSFTPGSLPNNPGPRKTGPSMWTDAVSNTAYVFGGVTNNLVTYYNDLWRWNFSSPGNWTAVGGSLTASQTNVVVTAKGVYAAGNWPGGRIGATTFRLAAAPRVAFVYGGTGLATNSATVAILLGDLWAYNMSTGLWAWLDGNVDATPTPTVAGQRNVPSALNYPGVRYMMAAYVDTTQDTVYIFGGARVLRASSNDASNDLWRGTYDRASQRIVWTWLLGPTDISSRGGSYPSSYGSFCTSCFPPVTSMTVLVMFPNILTAGGGRMLFMFGGVMFSQVRNQVWAFNVDATTPGAVFIAGSRGDNSPAIYPSFGAPAAPFVPPARGSGIFAIDPSKLARLNILGGSAMSPEGLRPANDVWTMDFMRLSISTPTSVQIGVPFVVTAQLLYPWGESFPVTGNLSITNVTTSYGALNASNWAFVNGVFTVALMSSDGSGPTMAQTLTIHVGGARAAVVISVACDHACGTCTGAGIGVTTCTSCNYAAVEAYRRSAVTGLCVATCEDGYYKGATTCLPCATGCSLCQGPGLFLPNCLYCNATMSFGFRTGSAQCTFCDTTNGAFLYSSSCSSCPPVYFCALPGNITCQSATVTSCPLCLTGYFLSTHSGSSDTCERCTDCSDGGKYFATNCTTTANAVCGDCTTCTSGQYRSRVCSLYEDAMCEDCAPVPNCAVPVTCPSSAQLSICTVCAPGFYLRRIPGAADVCVPCDSCRVGEYVAVACQALSNVTCSTCQHGCAVCTASSLILPTCSQCDEALGFAIDVTGTSCVPSCGSHEWKNTTTPGAARCTACDVTCLTCDGPGALLSSHDGGCITCDEASGALVSADRLLCVTACRTGQFQNLTGSPHACEQCTTGVCAAGQYIVCTDDSAYQCASCDAGCRICTGPGLALEASGGECGSCDERVGYVAATEGSSCVRCAANCTTCSGDVYSCLECAEGFAGPPNCAPVCRSPGCINCYAPDACGSVCEGGFAGEGCLECSGQAAVGSTFPNCVPARTTDPIGTGVTMGLLALLMLVVLVVALRFPLPVFFSGSQTIVTPNARLPLRVDFVLSTRELTVGVDSPVPVDSVMLEGVGLMPGTLPFKEGEKKDPDLTPYLVNMHLTEKQTRNALSGGYHVHVTADAGLGPVTTKHPLRFPMRSTGANMIALLSLVIEFVQLSAFSFGSDVGWWSKDPVQPTLRYSLVVLPSIKDLWYYAFWACAVIALVFSIFVVILKLRCDQGLRRKSHAYVAFANVIYGSMMPFIGLTLYMPIISIMLSALACSKSVTSPTSNYVANFDTLTQLVCWEGSHLIYVAIAAATILTFYPLAVFTLPVWQTVNPNLDVRYFPKYLIVTGQVKFVLAVTNQLFAKVPFVQAILLIVFSTPVVFYVLYKPPSIVYRLRWVIMASYAGVAWAGVSSLVATTHPDQYLSSVVLYAGWGLVLIVTLFLEFRPTKMSESAPPPAATDALDRVFSGADSGAKKSKSEAFEATSSSTAGAAYVTTTAVPEAMADEGNTEDAGGDGDEGVPLMATTETDAAATTTSEVVVDTVSSTKPSSTPPAKPAPSATADKPTRKPAALNRPKK